MRSNEWTEEEIDLLRRRREERIAVPLIAAELGRPVAATYARARKIGTRVMGRKVWTEDDVARLIALDAARVGLREIGAAMARPEASIRWKLDELGLGGKRVVYWTAAEDEVLARFAKDKTIGEVDFAAVVKALAEVGAERLEAAVELRIKMLKLTVPVRPRWTKEEVNGLKVAVAANALEAFATTVGRPLTRVRAKAVALGLVTLSRQYSAAEDAVIREGVAADRGLDEMAAEIGRPTRGVRARAVELGILEAKVVRPLDAAAKREIVDAVAGGMTVSVAMKTFGRDSRVLKTVVAEAGVAFAKAVKPRKVKAKTPKASKVSMPVSPDRRVAPAEKKVVVRLSTGFRVMAPLPKMDMSDAVARFLEERGVTRPGEDDVLGNVVTGLRRRGYSVVGGPDGWVIDGRVTVADQEALMAFARQRGVINGVAMQAAE